MVFHWRAKRFYSMTFFCQYKMNQHVIKSLGFLETTALLQLHTLFVAIHEYFNSASD